MRLPLFCSLALLLCLGGCGAGETTQNPTILHRSNFLGIPFHDGIAERYLAITTEDECAISPNGDDGGRVKLV